MEEQPYRVAAAGDNINRPFAWERTRRMLLNDSYFILRSLIPNPTERDRASIVGDAIVYIRELQRTMAELKVMVEKKRCGKQILKKPKIEENDSKCVEEKLKNLRIEEKELKRGKEILNKPKIEENEWECIEEKLKKPQVEENESEPVSWFRLKSKNTEVDVRIEKGEATVKMVQKKRVNCLVYVCKVLDEFQMDLHHVKGGINGDNYAYHFKSKICMGSNVCANDVANKLVEVVETQHAAVDAACKKS